MTRSVEAHAARILSSLYAVETALLIVLAGAYKSTAYDSTLLSTKAGAALILGVVGLIASGHVLARQVVAGGSARGKALAFGVTTNVLSVLVGFLLLEAAVRILATSTPAGIVVGSVAVRPAWPELVAQSRQVLAAARPWGTWDSSYFVYDRELGWTVGPNRRSRDGLYFSSVEGIRSAGPDVRMKDQDWRVRVALIGDSQAFSFEVPFEGSWGHHLQQLLGSDVQVLNFGVDGYGIDQMYLRYQRDVRPWRPRVVVIGVSGHDLRRTMVIYPLVDFGWPGYIVKPRFVREHEQLRLLNVPLPEPDTILRTRRVAELPFVEYDPGCGTRDWYWRDEHWPLLLRFLTSAFPPASTTDRLAEETKTLNSLLFTRIITSIEQDGAVPLVVLMSSRNELVPETLRRAHVAYLDVTECVAAIPVDRRLVASGNHYSGLANQAVARCTAPAVERALGHHTLE